MVVGQREPIWDLELFEGPSGILSKGQEVEWIVKCQASTRGKLSSIQNIWSSQRPVMYCMQKIRGSFRFHSESSWTQVKSDTLTSN